MMKTIGLLGGMGWPSTIEYYRLINETVSRKLGGLHSAKILLYSVDFGEIEKWQRQDEWEKAGVLLAKAAQTLERAGADLLLICSNTMHKVADVVRQSIHIPFVHVADVTSARIQEAGLVRVGLLGTRYTMEQDYLKQRFSAHGLQVLIPVEEDRKTLHRIIFEELCQEKFLESSRNRVHDMIKSLARSGAQGIVFGCTEISLLIRPEEVPFPVFDTTAIHAESAVALALETTE